MHDQYLPQHWKKYINDKFGDNLLASDFDGSVVLLDLEDGSTIRFNYAFYAVDEEREEILVFTEHCGYYCFPTRGLHYRKVPFKNTPLGFK